MQATYEFLSATSELSEPLYAYTLSEGEFIGIHGASTIKAQHDVCPFLSGGLSVGVIAAIVVGSVAGVAALAGIVTALVLCL